MGQVSSINLLTGISVGYHRIARDSEYDANLTAGVSVGYHRIARDSEYDANLAAGISAGLRKPDALVDVRVNVVREI